MIQSSISLSLEVQPRIKNELTFRNRRHHRLVRKRGSKLTIKPGTKRQISLHRGTTWVTSVLPNAKLTLSPVSQVYTWMRPARDFPPKFERYNTWLTALEFALKAFLSVSGRFLAFLVRACEQFKILRKTPPSTALRDLAHNPVAFVIISIFALCCRVSHTTTDSGDEKSLASKLISKGELTKIK